jgi:hypothetical protein
MESESSTSVPLKKKPKKVQERPVKMDPVEMIRVESEVCSKLASILRSLQDIDVSVKVAQRLQSALPHKAG